MVDTPLTAGWRHLVRKYSELNISIVSLVGLLASSVALSSKYWIVLKDAANPPPPLRLAGRVEIFDLEATYFATSFGLWLACFEKYNETFGLRQDYQLPNDTCTYINHDCQAAVLVVINATQYELEAPVSYFSDCDALMVVRAFGYLHATLTLIGCTMQWGFPIFERSFLWGSTVLMVAFLLCTVCIGVWFGEIYNSGNNGLETLDGRQITLNTYYETGWSLILLAVADLLIMVAAIGGMVFASNQAAEVFDSVRHNAFISNTSTRRNDFRTSPIADSNLRRINTITSYSHQFNQARASADNADGTSVANLNQSQSGLTQRVRSTNARAQEGYR